MNRRLIEKIKAKVGYGNLFTINEIIDREHDYDTVKSMVALYVKQGRLIRYCHGVYYIPYLQDGSQVKPSNDDAVYQLYLSKNKKVFGYLCGNSFLAELGYLPHDNSVYEVTTNLETNIKRKIKYDDYSVIVHRPYVQIDNYNVYTLQFLDFFRNSLKTLKHLDLINIVDYMHTHYITKKSVDTYINYFPKKVTTNILATGIYDILSRDD